LLSKYQDNLDMMHVQNVLKHIENIYSGKAIVYNWIICNRWFISPKIFNRTPVVWFFQTLLMKAWPHGHTLWELSTDICVINEQLKDKNLISYMSVCNEMFINDAINIQCIPSHTEPSVAALGYHPSVWAYLIELQLYNK
jgi:hypothetical protein